MPSPRQRYPLKRRALELSLPRVGEGHWTDGPDDDHKLGIYREKLEHERGQMEEARVKLAALEQQIPTDATKKQEWEKIHKEQCNALKVDVIRHESSVQKIKEGFSVGASLSAAQPRGSFSGRRIAQSRSAEGRRRGRFLARLAVNGPNGGILLAPSKPSPSKPSEVEFYELLMHKTSSVTITPLVSA